ncbi:MAG TPA: pilus assembly protein PilP [Steroidobacteraceae bacterium]|jgi:type IV pilus assembly protein PilP|nr:pilus assembly protein PilP [Steroidobacteraceae bacterium]
MPLLRKTFRPTAARVARPRVATPALLLAAGAACVALLAGCSGGDADLNSFIKRVKAEPGGRVEPLPEIKPYEAFTYSDQNLRSPFVPTMGGANTVRPDAHRVREFLEQYSLDTLKMVGTLTLGGSHYGLVLASDGRVHRVVIGNHMGQNDGTVTEISASKITLTEIVPDGLGGYVERPAALALTTPQ